VSQGIDLSSAGRIPPLPAAATALLCRSTCAQIERRCWELLESLAVDICWDDHHRLPGLFDLTSTSRAVNIAAACIHSFGGVRIAASKAEARQQQE